MKQKTNKKVAFVLAAALCAAIAVPVISAVSGMSGQSGQSPFKGVYGNTFTAFAEESAAGTEAAVYTMQTKGMYSTDNAYLLLTTNIDDVTKYKEVGYTVSVNGGEASDTGSATYYDGITFKTDAEGGTVTQTMEEIFADNVVTGMIVTEIEYSAENSYSITPYLVTNEGVKEEGTTVAVGVRKVNITLQLPAGFEVPEYVSEALKGEPLVLPTEEQITNNTGRTLAGWYDVNKDEEVTDSTVIAGDMTIAPYFEPETGVGLRPCYGADNRREPDMVGTYDESNVFTHWQDADGGNVSLSNVFVSPAPTSFIGGQKGTIVESLPEYSFKANDAFRIKTASNPAMDGNTEYRIDYSITNLGETDLKMHVYQITSQSNLSSAIDLKEQTFAAGKTVTLSTTLTTKNNNLMTMFRFTEDAEGIKMKIDMSMKVNVNIEPATITVAMPKELTVNSDYNTSVNTGDKLVVPTASQITGTPADGREIEGWYIVETGEIITEDTIVKDNAVTIAPYFSRRSGTATLQQISGDTSANGNPLVFNNVQNTNLPMNVYDASGADIKNGYSTYFNVTSGSEYVNDTAIGGGKGGYAELGNVLSTKSGVTLEAGMAFRCGTKISESSTVVPVNQPITFYYNFQNFGDSAIHLTIQGVNSGSSVEGPVTNIDLGAGESMSVSFTVTYTKGSANKNVMAYFTAVQDIVNMKLGVSVNVVL